MTTINAKATRSGDWWAVEFTSPAGQRYTQARRLDQIEAMVRDICDMDGIEVSGVEVAIAMPTSSIDAYREAAKRVQEASQRASAAARDTVTGLRSAGLSVRDVATLMGISPQRVSQLAKSA